MTNDLVTINNNQIVVSSRMVAEKFSKRHTHVLDSIKQLISSAEKSAEWFCRSSYKDSSGKTNVEYLMNRDGFSLLVMGFTGTEALKWKIEFINAFNAMETELKRIHDIELGRLIERQRSKEIRRSLTDVIRDDYPDSPHKRFMYKNFTDLVYKSVFGKNAKKLREELSLPKDANLREVLSAEQLKAVEDKEELAKSLVKAGYNYEEVKLIIAKKYIGGLDK